MNTEKEAGTAGDPFVLWRESAAGDDAMHMRMEQQILAPAYEG